VPSERAGGQGPELLGAVRHLAQLERAMTTYIREQWIEAFARQMLTRRPYLARGNAIDAIGASAWHLRATDEDDPATAANELSKVLDAAHAADHPPLPESGASE
jgi:hypothetical protein